MNHFKSVRGSVDLERLYCILYGVYSGLLDYDYDDGWVWRCIDTYLGSCDMDRKHATNCIKMVGWIKPVRTVSYIQDYTHQFEY